MKEMAPASVRDMLADQLLRPVLPLLPCAVTQVLVAVRFRALEVRRQLAEICGCGGSIIGLSHQGGMGSVSWRGRSKRHLSGASTSPTRAPQLPLQT